MSRITSLTLRDTLLPDTEVPIGILVAVREELSAILKKIPQAETEWLGGIRFYHGEICGHRVTLAQSGMGSERAGTAARILIRRFCPVALIVAGFAAGLSERAEPGTLILADPIIDDEASFESRLHPDPAMLEQLHAVASSTSVVGPLVTIARIATTAAGKEEFAKCHPDAVAIDMESAGAAAVAASADVPFAAIRAVTDGLIHDLAFPFDRFISSSGEVSRLRLAAALLVGPHKLPPLRRLGERSRLAARNLAECIEAYLSNLPHLDESARAELNESTRDPGAPASHSG